MKIDGLLPHELAEMRKRVLVLSGIIVVIFSLLASRLWYLQVMEGEKYSDYARGNRIRLMPQPALRGIIYDRNGKVLAENRPSYQIHLIREDTPDLNLSLKKLSKALDIPIKDLQTKVRENRKVLRFKPIILVDDVDYEKAMLVESYQEDLPGISVVIRPLRYYPYEKNASHVLGYVGVVEEEWFELPENKRRSSQIAGKSGVELLANNTLVGIDGGRQIEVDHLGRELKVISKPVPPSSGKNIHLSLDIRIQQVVDRAMEGETGSVVVMNPKTGDLLAMGSYPNFNPNLFAGGIEREHWEGLLNNPEHPLENKAIQGLYPLGSIFKVVTAYAGLETGVLDYETTHVCNGYYDLLGRKKLPDPDEISKYKTIFKCWKEGGHGKMDLHSAIRESCNVFFYNVGIEVGAEDLARVARKFGLGKVTGIDLLNEKEGLVPNDAWKQSVLREPWYKGETPPLSIGQGYLNVTPIQVVHMINILVNQGLSVPPKLYAGQPNTQPTQLPLNQEFLKRIGDGMVAVGNETGGTASSVRNEDFIIGGKTATSQVVSLETLESLEEENREERDFQNHGWFVAYAPAEDPEISVIVLVEHGGAGSRAAAPVARKILDFYYNEIHLPRMQAQSRPSSIQSGSKTPYSTLLESAFLQRPKSIRRSFVMMN